jgi:hypothetical protein
MAVVERRGPRKLATLEMALDRAGRRREALSGERAHLMAPQGASARRTRVEGHRTEPPRDQIDELHSKVTRSAARLFNISAAA